MLDHHIPPSSYIPTCQRHNSSYDSTTDTEFDFWASFRTQSYDKINHIGGSDAELEVEPHTSRSIEYEPSSPLLPRNHHFSSISPKSRMCAVAEGRKELMEMIANMPESSYELSLKDIVVDQQHMMQEVREDIPEETSFHFETEAQQKKKKKSKSKKSSNSGRISRTGSMEKEAFLIKMFFPGSLETKKTGRRKKSSKKAAGPSIEGSSKCIDYNWIKRVFVAEESKINRRNSSSNNNTSRHDAGADDKFLSGCWPFYGAKKSKSRRCTECIF